MEGMTTELINPRSTVCPKFICACKHDTNQLLRANLLTGEQSYQQIPGYEFKELCRWCELPGGDLLITGGHEVDNAVREVVQIETLRECAVCSQPPMHSARQNHAVLYHSQYVYVLGGYSEWCLRACERYVVAEHRWEELPALPFAGCGMSAVELHHSLYALGGCDVSRDLNTVQKFSLDSLTWELRMLKLPQAASDFPCFKTDTQVYLVIKETLYSFSPLQVKPIKTVPESIWCYSSYYSRGTLYYSWYGKVKNLVVGELTTF
jgi:hypothetical protein